MNSTYVQRLWLGVYFCLCSASVYAADSISLVRVTDQWRYFKGWSEPTSPMNAWRQIGFDDSGWGLGYAGFGYGDGDDATTFDDMENNYASAYIRRTFTVENPADIKWLVLRMAYDDGFVAYLNGTEMWKLNMISNPPYNTLATAGHEAADAVDIDVSWAISLLVTGTNVLAIQGHNVSLTSSDFSLIPELLANFNRGPFIQSPTETSVKVVWRTPVATDAVVEYGTTPALGSTVTDPTLQTDHVITITGLSAGTEYYYRIKSAEGGKQAVSPIYTFKTLTNSGDLSFLVLGDSGAGRQSQYEVAQVMKDVDADLAVHVGDVIYPNFTYGRADLKCLSIYGEHMRERPYYFALGNHDMVQYSSGGVCVIDESPFLNTFHLPTNSTTGTEHYYSFDQGDAHFIVLSSDLRLHSYKMGSDQYDWLEADLQSTSKPWKFIFLHHPPYTSTAHRFDDNEFFGATNCSWAGNGTQDREEIQASVGALAGQYGVQVMFYGHDHSFEKFNPVSGVHSILSGGGGIGLRDMNVNNADKDEASSQYHKKHHCVKVTIEGDHLELQAIDKNGVVFDKMYIQRSMPPTQVYGSTWNSPVVESAAANDGDGNITNQELDFIGTPVPTIPGGFSNLGRVFVNNDATNVYIAFEQTLFYADNNFFFFIDSPNLSGVSTMSGVGNGVVDPMGQGVDGLDFLHNLSFTSFSPDIGCVFGDEFGDGQFREFLRPAMTLNIGQGLYHLDASLSGVNNVVLQQYNRTPQESVFDHEQNANLVEMTIPLSSLGNPLPGQLLKLGAVVAGGSVNTDPGSQTRYLDTAYLGQSLAGSGFDPVTLESISVQLTGALDDPDNDGLTNQDEVTEGTRPDIADTDMDLLLDGWEASYDLDPLSDAGIHGTSGDVDNDGFNNWAEQLAGTVPTNGASFFEAVIVQGGVNDALIGWSGISNRHYDVYRTYTLYSNFTPVVTGLAGYNGMNMWTDSVTSVERAFYFIEVKE